MRLGLLTAPFPDTPLDDVADWTVAHGFDSVGMMGRQEAEPFFTGGHWMEIALALRRHWRSVWLVPLPIRL